MHHRRYNTVENINIGNSFDSPFCNEGATSFMAKMMKKGKGIPKIPKEVHRKGVYSSKHCSRENCFLVLPCG